MKNIITIVGLIISIMSFAQEKTWDLENYRSYYTKIKDLDSTDTENLPLYTNKDSLLFVHFSDTSTLNNFINSIPTQGEKVNTFLQLFPIVAPCYYKYLFGPSVPEKWQISLSIIHFERTLLDILASDLSTEKMYTKIIDGESLVTTMIGVIHIIEASISSYSNDELLIKINMLNRTCNQLYSRHMKKTDQEKIQQEIRKLIKQKSNSKAIKKALKVFIE